jgi:uncharacterized membrane protein SpoIIM required for sporulation
VRLLRLVVVPFSTLGADALIIACVVGVILLTAVYAPSETRRSDARKVLGIIFRRRR